MKRDRYGHRVPAILAGFAVLKLAEISDATTMKRRVPEAFHHHHLFRSSNSISIQSATIQSIGRNNKCWYRPLNQQKYPTSSSNDQPSPAEPESESTLTNLDDIERIFAISDLHTDKAANMEWLRERCTMDFTPNQKIDAASESSSQNAHIPGPKDALIIAGDISHKISILRETLSIIRDNLKCHIFFVWGNHEAWVGGDENDSLGLETSLEKIDAIKDVCRQLGVHVQHRLVGATNAYPVWITPIEGWYDATLSLDGCEDLCANFAVWPWVDFVRCTWPGSDILNEYKKPRTKGSGTSSLSSSSQIASSIEVGRIPLGLTELISQRNVLATKEIRDEYLNWAEAYKSGTEVAPDATNTENPPGLITFSHFLTNQMSLPDWKDPSSEVFLKEKWLDHTAPQISAKFAKVAGSLLLDKQIRSIVPHKNMLTRSSSSSAMMISDLVQHLHVFGHSHRPKDFVADGVRYVHNPLGKPTERDWDLVSSDVGFQLIWDCKRCSLPMSLPFSDGSTMSHATSLSSPNYRPGGEVPGKRIIRFWEEKEGGAFARKVMQKNLEKISEIKRISE